MDRVANILGTTRLGVQMWLVSLLGWALTEVPGDNYRPLRFLGAVMVWTVIAFYAREAWRWVRANGARKTALAVASWVPSVALSVWFFYGPWWWPVRVVTGFALMVAAMVAWALALAVLRAYREARS